MEYQTVINHGFKLFVEKTFRKESIRNYLLNHERKTMLVDNLTKELKGVEFIVLKNKLPQEQKREMIKSIINDFSRMFCNAAIEEVLKKRGANGSQENGTTTET